MIIREEYRLDTEGRKRLFVDVECEVCGIEFSRQSRQLKNHTCSSSCLSVSKGKAKRVSCGHCNKEFNKSLYQIALSKSGIVFCSRECKDSAQIYMKEIQPGHYGTGKTRYRDKALRELPNMCNRCGYNNVKALDVHHKDHNRDNNDISNLEILCCNCHAIEHR